MIEIKFSLKPMEEEEAHFISRWHYDEPYSFYDFIADLQDAQEFLDFKNRAADRYFSVLDDSGNLTGFFEFIRDSNCIEIGLGMRPDLTGRGLGLSFLNAGIDFAWEKFDPQVIRLKVASFNKRAQKVYERAGFRHTRTLLIETNDDKFEFVEMELKRPK